MSRVRAWSAVLAVLALAAGCSLPKDSSTTAPASTPPPASSVLIQHVQTAWGEQTIKPTAIVLHWWDDWGNGHDINRLVADLNGNVTNYNPTLTSSQPHPSVGHTTVQIGVLGNGQAYQLTPKLNTFARHAKCANDWAIGIEIEGFGPGQAHYIGDDKAQFNKVVAVVKYLMGLYHIKAQSVVADDGKSGQGIVSHQQVDKQCQWADGAPAGTGKVDVDSTYLHRVLKAVGG